MRLVSFGTYPAGVPLHGGQRRTHAIRTALEAEGFDQLHISAERRGSYRLETEDLGRHFLSGRLLRSFRSLGKRTDVHAAELFEDENSFARLAGEVEAHRPELLMCEQPWLWPAVRKLRAAHPELAALPVVYSSHNIESELIRTLTGPTDSPSWRKMHERTQAIEEELTREAALVVAVTEGDAAHFERIGARRTIVCGNGVAGTPQPGRWAKWGRPYGTFRIALFSGSAHPPNAQGFLELLEPPFGYMRPDERICCVGRVADLLEVSPRFNAFRSVNLSRMLVFGEVEEAALGCAIWLASLFLLPVVSGGGSNVKTAEALYNRKPIVGTSTAFRGFERFADLPWVTIADEPGAFQAAMLEILRTSGREPIEPDEGQRELLEKLTWQSTLKDLPAAMRAVANGVR